MVSFKQFLIEASTGQAKWDKYFGDEVETIAKADSQLFDIVGDKIDKTIKKGEKLTVLAGEYDTKPLVKIGKGTYRMKFSDIDKPFKVEQTVKIHLKPDELGLDGKTKFSSWAKKVKDAIVSHSDIPDQVGEYLKALVDHAKDPNKQDYTDAVTDMYTMAEIGEDTALKNTIANDFMEILGPFFVVNEKPEFKSGSCYFPELGNEPLYDFSMFDSDGAETRFSSKRSGGNSNTIKVSEIIKAATPALKKKFKREMELLNIINDNSVKAAPALINAWLADNFPAYKAEPDPADNAAIARLEYSLAKWITNNSDLKFDDLVKNAIPDLWYVKAKLNSDGTIKVEPLKSGRELGDVKLRSKSSPGHLSDKLGFAV